MMEGSLPCYLGIHFFKNYQVETSDKEFDKPNNGLTDKQFKFCNEYVIDHNASQAAIRAGYSRKSANRIGWLLLQHAGVKDCVAKLDKELLDDCGITARMITAELAAVAFARVGNFVKVEEYEEQIGEETVTAQRVLLKQPESLTDEQQGAICEVRQTANGVCVKMHNKLSALDKLSKHLATLRKSPSAELKEVKRERGPTMLLGEGRVVEI
jgi:phage terminase small subunit